MRQKNDRLMARHRRLGTRILLVALSALIAGACAAEVAVYDARVLEKKPFERRNFVQGLEFHEGSLLVSAGRFGESAIRRYQWPELDLLQEKLLPTELWGEGLTRVGKRLYVLTWQARKMLIYNADSLEFLGSAAIPGEGWGLTHNGNQLYFSDGSDRIFSVDGSKGGKLKIINVTLNNRPVTRINELEWVDGEIWANVFTRDYIIRIDPESGAVTGVIFAEDLLTEEDKAAKDSQRWSSDNVLNGIARDPATGDVWITGKRWPWLFKIALEPRG